MKITIKRGDSLTNVERDRFNAGLQAETEDPMFKFLASQRRRTETRGQQVQSDDAKVVTDFIYQIADRLINSSAEYAKALAVDEADLLMADFFIWVAGVFFVFGPLSPEGNAVLAEAGVAWKPLSPKYLSEKERLGLSSGYWRFTGKLRRQFISRNSRRRHMFGAASAKNKSIVGFKATISIDAAPDLNGLTSGQDLERRIISDGFGGAEDLIRKLQGRLEYYRPLLGPALSFYIKNVVQPGVIKKLASKGYKMKRIRATENSSSFLSGGSAGDESYG